MESKKLMFWKQSNVHKTGESAVGDDGDFVGNRVSSLRV